MIPQYCIAHPYHARFFASLARANELVHLHSKINFPQAKLDSELNARFLLTKHGNLYFLLLNSSVHVILFDLKIFKKFSERKKI